MQSHLKHVIRDLLLIQPLLQLPASRLCLVNPGHELGSQGQVPGVGAPLELGETLPLHTVFIVAQLGLMVEWDGEDVIGRGMTVKGCFACRPIDFLPHAQLFASPCPIHLKSSAVGRYLGQLSLQVDPPLSSLHAL